MITYLLINLNSIILVLYLLFQNHSEKDLSIEMLFETHINYHCVGFVVTRTLNVLKLLQSNIEQH